MDKKIWSFAVIGALVFFSACTPKKSIKNAGKTPGQEIAVDTTTVPALAGGSLEESATPEANIRGGDFETNSELGNITFEFDKYSLSDAAIAQVTKNAATLKAKKNHDILVEGHCDERGTIEYNIALGQKRAKEVRDYYIRLGVPAAAVTTISYGKEKPLCQDSNEDCWAKNRRAETKLRAKAAVDRE